MTYGLALLIISLFWVTSEIILGRLKHSGTSATPQDKSSLRLLWFTIAVTVTIGGLLSAYHQGTIRLTSRFLPLCGLGLIIAGLLIRWVAILTLWRYFTVDVSIDANHKLVSTGLYRFVRHPAYTGSLLSFLGLGLAFANWWSLAIIVIPVTGAFLYRIKVEEKALVAFFGDDYIRYCASTKRLVPGIY